MKHTKVENLDIPYNPLDVIEDIIISNGWEFERDKNKNLHVEVGGNWCEYQLSFGYNEANNIIYISCALDIRISQQKHKEVFSLLAKINEKLTLGHFEVWLEDGWPIYRCSIPFTPNLQLCKKQIERISALTLEECDKFYPAFQFLAWGDKDANESIRNLMLETKGEV
ncbi:MAG: hypothetical protein CMP24_04145 [Rickettsiales bacterium]|nr:hypothetical protein [Rickettsiales bacterium]|tara:strand:+ start:461 stop:964 length:504 start_codon:yes stop_codon:yes gene_type:complete